MSFTVEDFRLGRVVGGGEGGSTIASDATSSETEVSVVVEDSFGS